MTTIRNGRGIADVQYRQDAGVEGEPLGKGFDRPFENPQIPQISTLTLAAQADVSDEIVAGQVWTTTLTDPDGVAYTDTYTVTAADDTAGTDGAGLAYMAGVLAASLEANASLVNIISASASGAVQTLSWLHPNQGVWTLTQVCTPAAAEVVLLSTPATSQTAGGVTIPMGRFVAWATPEGTGLRRGSLPTASTDVIAGIALRDITQVRVFDTTPDAVDQYPIGSIMSVRQDGDARMVNVGDSAAVGGGPVWSTISTTGGDTLGQARADRDGVAQVTTGTPTSVNDATYRLQIDIPEFEDLPALSRTFEILADAGTSATEICDAFRTRMALDAAFTARVVASGTTTLVLTGQFVGMSFTVLDVQEGAGDWTSITLTTAAASYTALVPEAKWSRDVAAGALGVLTVVR